MVKTTIGNIKGMAEFFYSEYPNVLYDDIFKEYARLIFSQMEQLSVGVKFMLSMRVQAVILKPLRYFSSEVFI